MKTTSFGSVTEALLYPLLLLIVMWMVFWADSISGGEFYKFGVRPQDYSSIQGVFLMPLIHSQRDFAHIINNSFPTFVLLAALIYFYREIALKVFIISWIVAGLGLLVFAHSTYSFHIGMSGVIFALASFLFLSGVIRKFLPLQGISLFVAFVYGSMIWGIFPTQTHVSWEGHLSGLVAGILLAFLFRNKGPQRPKLQYEIEKDLGIEPPDLEAIWLENKRIAEEKEKERLEEELERKKNENQIRIVYQYKDDSKNSSEKGDSEK